MSINVINNSIAWRDQSASNWQNRKESKKSSEPSESDKYRAMARRAVEDSIEAKRLAKEIGLPFED